MTQDTRKDRRVKIVSLNVRYKSATVDEFIENHAHDVSRGGIYIKTGTPFPSGTLLKFEVRLASDQAVITGVGRVVWKRDTTQGTADRPAGMGVKFIKIDDSSRAVIDKLVNSRADAGKTYEAEVETAPRASERPAAAASVRPAAPKSPTPPAVAPAAPAPRLGKGTMVGLGFKAPSTAPPRPASFAPAPAPTPAPPPAEMFPKAGSTRPASDDEARQEPTVMKQAAELLEEALREAGGSMEEVGTNPLFAGSTEPAPAKAQSPASSLSSRSAADEVTVHKLLSPIPDAPVPDPAPVDEAAKARAMVAELSPGAAARKAPTDPPRTARDAAETKAITGRPAAKKDGGPAQKAAPPKKSGSGRTIVFLAVVAAAVAAGVVYRDQLFGSAAAPEEIPAANPSPPAPAAVSPPPVPVATSAAPSAAASAPVEPPRAAAPSPSGAASTPAASTGAVHAAVVHAAAVHAAPSPAKPSEAAPPAAKPAEAPAPKAPPPSDAKATTAATAKPAPPAAPKASPAAKPAAADDNPY